MNEIKKKSTRKFRVIGDISGSTIIYRRTEFIHSPTFGNPENWEEGASEFRFYNGDYAKRLDDGTFQHVESGEVFRVASERDLTVSKPNQ